MLAFSEGVPNLIFSKKQNTTSVLLPKFSPKYLTPYDHTFSQKHNIFLRFFLFYYPPQLHVTYTYIDTSFYINKVIHTYVLVYIHIHIYRARPRKLKYGKPHPYIDLHPASSYITPNRRPRENPAYSANFGADRLKVVVLSTWKARPASVRRGRRRRML